MWFFFFCDSLNGVIISMMMITLLSDSLKVRMKVLTYLRSSLRKSTSWSMLASYIVIIISCRWWGQRQCDGGTLWWSLWRPRWWVWGSQWSLWGPPLWWVWGPQWPMTMVIMRVIMIMRRATMMTMNMRVTSSWRVFPKPGVSTTVTHLGMGILVMYIFYNHDDDDDDFV